VDDVEDDSRFVRFGEMSVAELERVGRVERQEVSSEVEIVGLGVMMDVCTTVPVAGTIDLLYQLTFTQMCRLGTYVVVVHLVEIGVDWHDILPALYPLYSSPTQLTDVLGRV
jgi:hypothetical protein